MKTGNQLKSYTENKESKFEIMLFSVLCKENQNAL